MGSGPTELLQQARSGQGNALGELCALYRNYLRMIVRTGMGPRLRERVELSDVVQEALVEVVRQFPQFTGESEAALVGWLRRLVAQKLADLGRYHSRAKRIGESEALPLDARRRLILLRRDDREHLVILGTNGETVVEQGIESRQDKAP